MKIGDYARIIETDNIGEIKLLVGKKVELILENGFTVKVNYNKIELCEAPIPFPKTIIKHKVIAPPPKVDLHIENLITDFKGLTNAEIILLQIDEFERQLDAAIASGMFEITFVHGIGAGKLREEIHIRLKKNKQIKSFMDAHYDRGSTVVKII